MIPRPCADCGQLFDGDGTYCSLHKSARKKVRNADRSIAKRVVEASPVCADCGSTTDLTAGHVVPLARGGSNHGARVTQCRSCNARQGSSLPGELGVGSWKKRPGGGRVKSLPPPAR